MISIRMLLASTAALGTLVSSAVAADLPPIYDTPLYQSVPEVQPVEIGSGWYLRGDVGYGFKSKTDSDWSIQRSDGVTTNAFDQGTYRDLDVGSDVQFAIGAGYRFTDYLRGDVTASRWTADAALAAGASTLAGVDNRGADMTGYELMANAYADLGTFVGFTPYLGAGAGATKLKVSETSCSLNGGACDLGGTYRYASTDSDDWRFTYSLMAGLAYDLSTNLKLDVGYKFTDVAGASYPSSTATNRLTGEEYRRQQTDDGFQRHAVTVGLRYSLW